MPVNVQATESNYHADYLEKQKAQNNTGSTLGKDEFLKLLLTQLQNQDPMNPMKDQEFIAQMAQFSALEQTTNMNSNLEKFLDMQTTQNFVSHSDLIGKQVEWDKTAEDDDTETVSKSGIVTSVIFKDGQAQLVIDGETKINTTDVVSVTNPK
ncbi:flagellar hook assembly protein FlgD [Salipaludibacillus neizhouensis]|uniref:Flagellar hook assembly protein FlgD n=1 Tax=Salipaludibacillus neizhouensis TaxID=885475 RepID=A0A3A9KBK5_9BACI|nr:flagellar hook assembly protein FlgD [Salipaludibacillus neizhouensis]RKL68998.1 flagellar hook assembly protein FlgD [Salipaludibacillus neizhouensis]